MPNNLPPDTITWEKKIRRNDLDAQSAFENFAGKSFAEAKDLFASHALNYQEDLQSMPFDAFNFYAPAMVDYIISDKAKGDSDGASSFIGTIIYSKKVS